MIGRGPLRGTVPLLLLLLSLLAAPALHAQGWWDLNLGPYHNAVDTGGVNGAMLSFSRFKGQERAFQKGFRFAYFRRWQDQRTYTPPPPSTFTHIIEEWGGWAMMFGMPIRMAPAGGPVKPYFEAVPSLTLYRSLHTKKYYGNPSDPVGLEDDSKWMIGPSVDFAAGMLLPTVGRVPRLNLRAGYRFGFMAGGPGIGTTAGSLWHGWELSAGMAVPY